jgi:hypothetical protein
MPRSKSKLLAEAEALLAETKKARPRPAGVPTLEQLTESGCLRLGTLRELCGALMELDRGRAHADPQLTLADVQAAGLAAGALAELGRAVEEYQRRKKAGTLGPPLSALEIMERDRAERYGPPALPAPQKE